MKPGTTVVLRNARITLFRGSMRLSVDRLQIGTENANQKLIQVVKLPPDYDFDVKMDSNLSVIEFEVITLDSLRDSRVMTIISSS
jgi:replication factor A1